MVTTMGIDLAKRVFQLHGVDNSGKVTLKKKLAREKLMEFIANMPPCLIGIEACGASHYWSRKFKNCGHTVKIMSPQYVKPYVKTNKNDQNDAEGICEAVTRPSMHFVNEKSIEQQDIQSIHRIRQRLVRARTALANEIRGLLGEYGIIVNQGIKVLRKELPRILEAELESDLTPLTREVFNKIYEEFCELDNRVLFFDNKIEMIFKSNEACQRIGKIEGIGPIAATAAIATIGNAKSFKNGRQLAAFLGLVPKQNSSGGKTNLLGISKRGDSYLRCLLIHGGRSVIRHLKNKEDYRSQWIRDKEKSRGTNKTAVAVANKNARIIWKMLVTGEDYRAAV